MNRLLINGRFLTQPVTGVQRYAIELVTQWDNWLSTGILSPSQWEMSLAVPRSGVQHDLNLSSIKIETVGRSTGHVWEQLELPKHVGTRTLFCPCNTAPVRTLRRLSPTVVTVHDLSYRYFPHAYSWAFRAWYDILMPAVYKHADRIITVAQCEKRAMLDHFPSSARRIRVIQNGCVPPETALASASSAPAPDVRAPYILYVGSLSRRKNFQGVIAASEILFSDFPDLTTVLVGGGTKVFNQQGVPVPASMKDRFVFLGQVDDPKSIHWLYRHASCFVFPSFYEASPLPPMEAMASGCPVVASAIPSHHERLGDAALYCDPNDPADIAHRVATVLRNEGVSNGLVTRGIKRAAEYTWHGCALETLRVIDEVTRPTAVPGRSGDRKAA